MDTKLKNRLTIIIWVLLFTFGLSGVFSLLSNADEYTNSYYDTYRFQDKLTRYVSYLSTYALNSMTKEEAKAALTVTDQEIENYRSRYRRPSVAQEQSEQKVEEIRAKILKEKKKKIEENYQRKEQNRSQFQRLKSSFKYYLKDTKTDEVYTDLNIKEGESPDKYLNNMAFVQRYPLSDNGYLSTEGRDVIPGRSIGLNITNTDNTYSGFVAVPESLPANSVVRADYQHYHQTQTAFFIYIISGIIAFLISLFMIKKVPVFKFAENEKWQHYYNRVPFDVVLFLFIIILGYAYASTNMSSSYLFGSGILNIIEELIISAVFVSLTVLQANFLWKRLKEKGDLKTEWEKSVLNQVMKGLSDAFLNQSTGGQWFLFLGIIFASGFGVMVVMIEPAAIMIYVPLFIVVTVPALIMIVRRIGYFNRIVHNARGLVSGNAEPDLPVKGKSTLAVLAGNINTLKKGVETSQAEQARSERFKTELITNVSHDLRTPLTSIITYSELLKTPDLSNEDRDAYIEIIDRKSKRLKVLIEDLFEASKIASGSIDLVKEKVDMAQLVEQALAENDETIAESTLQFRVSKPDTPVYCIVDGQKIWRVFDNLIGNILKYSLTNTRVYISVETSGDRVLMTFKNITKYELSNNIDELFERFKRGDTSRHTDGSGLGLAIAKSIVDLHGGRMDIEVDGDLFKVTVSLQAVSH